jgi:cytochrome P450
MATTNTSHKLTSVLGDSSESSTASFTAALAVILGTSLLVVWKTLRPKPKQDNSLQSLPWVPTSIPFVGLGAAYFGGGPFPLLLRLKEEYGQTFGATVFGRPWVFCLNREDVMALYKAPDKQVSMLKPLLSLVGFTFPQDGGYPTKELEQKISVRGGVGQTNVFAMVHALKKDKMMAWIPSLRHLLKETFAKLPDQGTVSLFDWCQELITKITVQVLLGDVVAQDPEFLDTYTQLFNEGDPEAAFATAETAVQTLFETSVWGERRVFAKVRDLLDPYFDQEIQRICVDQEPESPDESMMQSFIRSWYAKLGQDLEAIQRAKRRLLNDIFFTTFAAFTNSYGGAAWLFYHILKNTSGCADKILPEIQQTQQAWDRAAQENKTPTEFDCPHLEMTLTEISRLYTPGGVLRETLVPFQLPSTGITLPPGTMVSMSVGMFARDPEIFSNPLDFDPSRHSPEQKRANPNYFMTPFGAGTHPCAGRKFAYFEMALFVMEAFAEFDLTLLPEQQQQSPTDAFTQQAIGTKQKNHPPLDPKQAAMIWRTAKPVIVQYKRKTASR